MMSKGRSWTVAVVACAVAVSCGPAESSGPEGSADVGGPDGESPPTAVRELAVVPNPSNVLSAYVEWTTDAPAATNLNVECGDEWSQRYQSETTRTDHRVFVMGLWAGASCTATASAGPDGGNSSSATVDFEAGSLPEKLPDLTVPQRQSDEMQAGWTLFNLWNGFDDVPLTAAMVDTRGRYRWYHRVSTSNSGSDSVVRRFRDGVLIGGNRQYVGPRYVNWQGEVQWNDSFRMHHEILPVSGESEFLYLTAGETCQQGQPRGSAVVRYDWQRGESLQQWNFCEFYIPENAGPDWSHLNTIERFPDESAVLVSSRTQHALFKLDLDRNELVWKMGIDGDFDISGDKRFFRQHAPEVQPDGNIVLFDNGSLDSGAYSRTWSRAIEISYDVEEGHAEIVWSYRPEPDLFAPIWGDADRLDNGNTLVTFGVRNRDSDKNSRIVEVTSDGSEVWRLDAPSKWGWYRADRVRDRPYGSVLEP